MYTTIEDFKAFTGQDYSPEDEERLTGIIDSAERLLTRQCGTFYDPDDREAPASKDWIEATCLITQARWLLVNDPAAQAALVGPYQSETLGDYRYQLRDGASGSAANPLALPGVAEIVAYYCGCAPPTALTGMGLAGPTRSRPPLYDPDVAFVHGDVSRGGLP